MSALIDDVFEQSEVFNIDRCGGVEHVATGEKGGISICSDVTESEMDDSFNDPDYVPDSPENKNIDLKDSSSLDNGHNNSDSDYVPDSESDDLSEIVAPITSILKMLESSDNRENNISENQSDNCENCDVVTAPNTSAFQCVYCGRSSTNISKHYLGMHKNEDDVRTISNLRKGSKERALELEKQKCRRLSTQLRCVKYTKGYIGDLC